MSSELPEPDPWDEAEAALATSLHSKNRYDGHLAIEWAEEIEPRLNSFWLVKKTLPQQGLALIYGHPGSGKSFFAMDLALHVALGWDWNGLRTRRGVVIYVAAEGQLGLRNRIAAFKRHYALDGPVPLGLVTTPINLYDSSSDLDDLREAVDAAAERYGHRPALIVIDTLSKTLGAGKENTDDLAVYVANCGALAAEFQCCVLPIHHRPKDTESTEPRGHGSLKGGVDTVILIDASQPRRARITKQKDDEERELLRFDLQRIELGCDDDNEPVSSCVVVPLQGVFAKEGSIPRTRRGLRPNQQTVLDEIGKAIAAEGVSPPDCIPGDHIAQEGKVIDLASASDGCIAALQKGLDIKPDSARRSFDRALQSLQDKGFIGICNQWVWLVR